MAQKFIRKSDFSAKAYVGAMVVYANGNRNDVSEISMSASIVESYMGWLTFIHGVSF